ncbi:energy-coupling factor ABC transporter substrate-binding protein [Dehalobacterium formicoaceticum]|uniref:Cobalt transport protein CbiN n=1 Tax=Dehalobacterium formicoaceticum TaxID=51515 RepID=A0ABT1Y1V5_9FIRM|nr:energy-coupling factor ABC transporter substrate-binding protein [Dehalobacterium formicoaceticum]MCR6544847.1 energy-coupling factor ABC transporter substrate-binding protein [Dehalobacterium formicoaceticum]
MKYSWILILIVIILAVTPLFLVQDSEFGGADGLAEEAITEVDPSYEPWFTPFWEPPGGETESLLFALQAALGAGFLGYYFGLKKGQAKAAAKLSKLDGEKSGVLSNN